MRKVLIQNGIKFLFLSTGLFFIGFSSPVLASPLNEPETPVTSQGSTVTPDAPLSYSPPPTIGAFGPHPYFPPPSQGFFQSWLQRIASGFRRIASLFQRKADEDNKKADSYEKGANTYEALAKTYHDKEDAQSKETAGWFQKIADRFRNLVAWFRGKAKENQQQADSYNQRAKEIESGINPGGGGVSSLTKEEEMARCLSKMQDELTERQRATLEAEGATEMSCPITITNWAVGPYIWWESYPIQGLCHSINSPVPPVSAQASSIMPLPSIMEGEKDKRLQECWSKLNEMLAEGMAHCLSKGQEAVNARQREELFAQGATQVTCNNGRFVSGPQIWWTPYPQGNCYEGGSYYGITDESASSNVKFPVQPLNWKEGKLKSCRKWWMAHLPRAVTPGNGVCQTDSDCVLVDAGCCGCNAGGKSTAVHISRREAHNKRLLHQCPLHQMCQAAYLCNQFVAKCQNSQCVTVRETVQRSPAPLPLFPLRQEASTSSSSKGSE